MSRWEADGKRKWYDDDDEEDDRASVLSLSNCVGEVVTLKRKREGRGPGTGRMR